MTPMKFRAQIKIDFEELDFLGAAEQQRRIQMAFDQLKEAFPISSLEIRQVRFGPGASVPAIKRTRSRAFGHGNLAQYED